MNTKIQQTLPFLTAFIGVLLGGMVGIVGAFLLAITVTGGDKDTVLATVLPLALLIGLIAGAILGARTSLRTLRYVLQTGAGAANRSHKVFVVVRLLITVPILVGGMIGHIKYLENPPPDQQLLANFDRQQPTLDRLVTMAQTDKKLTRVANTWTRPVKPQQIGVSPARIREYRRLLNTVGAPRGFQVWGNDDEIYFYYNKMSSGSCSNIVKGYAYLTKPPTPLLPSLDSFHANPEAAFRHIRGNWYLFCQFDPY